MFDLLDKVLTAILDDARMAPALQTLLNADVSFVTPDRHYKPTQETVNLFLYETRENRDLRDPVPIVETRNGLSIRRRPPLRVDCSYMVTAWSKKTGVDKVAAEHRLLSLAFNWLSRFPTIPERYMRVPNANPVQYVLPGQVFPPPTMVAQLDAAKNVGEFWSALGIPPRPYFNLVVTIAMDLAQEVEGAIVTTIATHYHAADPAAEEERIIIGGTVRFGGKPVADAWVRLEPAGLTEITDHGGRFVFASVARGTGMTLKARATGRTDVTRPNVDVPSLTGEYDLQFTT
jgi:uncharacterized protein DUF4255